MHVLRRMAILKYLSGRERMIALGMNGLAHFMHKCRSCGIWSSWNTSAGAFYAWNAREWVPLEWTDVHLCIKCTCAATNALEILQWAHMNGCPWNEDTCALAATSDNFKILQWVRMNGCPCNESTCADAVANGRFEILKWARANGCPWDKEECWWLSFAFPNIRQWILEN